MENLPEQFLNISEFGLYMGLHRKAASRLYKKYLYSCNKQEFQQLSNYDIAKMHGVEVAIVDSKIKNMFQ